MGVCTAQFGSSRAEIEEPVSQITTEMAPGEVSAWHHHDINDTYLHLVSGKANFEFGVAGTERVEAFEGDFVFIPAGTIHREINPGDSVSCAVLFRTGGGIPVINLEGPYIEKSEI